MPRSMTSTPTLMSPADAARANIGPLVRESRPSTTFGIPAAAAHEPSAAACLATSSGVRSLPTCPRIPETLIISVSDTDSFRHTPILPHYRTQLLSHTRQYFHYVAVPKLSGSVPELGQRLVGGTG